MADYKIIEKDLLDIRYGDVLGEDIGKYSNLTKDTTLDEKRIQQLFELNLKTVKIKVFTQREETSQENLSKDSIEKVNHEKLIEEGIERAYYENIMKKSVPLELKETDYSVEDKKEVKKIIDHIKEAQADIHVIESFEKKSLRTINNNINLRIRMLEQLLFNMIKDKVNKLNELEQIIKELIEDTGPKRDTTFLLLNVKRVGINYIVKHSINVCLISMATAIELTKMMTEKLNSHEVVGDFKKLSICNKKIFSKSELIKLGLAALVHDLNLIEIFPDLTENTKFSVKEKSKIELHPNNTYHFLSLLSCDYDIRNTVLHHHERIDGSGYPDGMKGMLFTKYTLVLSFADRIEQLINKSPFSIKLHPHKAIMYLLSEEREKFDSDVALAFCKGASIYPIGSWLLLSNNQIGVVFRCNRHNLKRPIIKCIYSADMKELLKKEFIDLSRSPLKIMELIDIESLKIFNVEIEQFIFDEREFERIPVEIEGKINILDSNVYYPSKIKDISLGGARVQLDKDLNMGDEVNVDFKLAEYEIQNKGIIVWTDGTHSPHNHFGIRFIKEDKNYKEALTKIVKS